jgi:hypothetical protein
VKPLQKLALHKESLRHLAAPEAEAVDGALQLVRSLRFCSVYGCIPTLQRGCPSLEAYCTRMTC